MKRDVDFPICQIVGYKNSGKTMLMKRLISYFQAQGMKVGSLKHHGHGGEPDIVQDTDSAAHFQAGSFVSGVQGEQQFHMMFRDVSHIPLHGMLQFYKLIPIDLLLIEGYKRADFPKIVLINHFEEMSLLKELSNIVAVGSWDKQLVQDTAYFNFSLHDLDRALPQLAKCITLM